MAKRGQKNAEQEEDMDDLPQEPEYTDADIITTMFATVIRRYLLNPGVRAMLYQVMTEHGQEAMERAGQIMVERDSRLRGLVTIAKAQIMIGRKQAVQVAESPATEGTA